MRYRLAVLPTLTLAFAIACDGRQPPADVPGSGGREAGSTTEQSDTASQTGRAADTRTSRYTSIAQDDCEIVRIDRETGGSRARCTGVGGFRLEVVEGDARASLDVLPPRGDRVPLGLSTMAGGAFSRLGPRVEWRADGNGPPDALIARYEAFEFPEQPERVRSYLVVAKLSPAGACVVATVAPVPAQNEQARRAADAAGRLPCVEPGVPMGGQSRVESPTELSRTPESR